MPTVRELMGELLGQVDVSLPGALYAAVSVTPERVRRWLRAAERPFIVHGSEAPEPDQLLDTGRWVIEQSRFKLTLVGGLAGLGGAASVPPEALASTIALLRLAQRLAIVFGFDPTTDRGEMAVWQALAAGFELELPGEGPMGMRVRDLPAVLVKGRAARRPSGALATAVLRESIWHIGSRLSRLLALPVLSSGLSATSAHRRATEVGERMLGTLQRLADAPPVDSALVEEAVELG
ncbi:MAG: hypothetical protein JRJ84_11490 [Deltaproteobacteria bacterium]|nr:hypothetical protein [Deltaproteobacteria bacterium]